MYAIRGQPIGMAVRSVAVVDNPALLQSVAVQPQDSSVRITVPSNAPVADLTVTITVADPQIGRLGWSFNVTGHQGAGSPSHDLREHRG